jgi:hypothetical protein
MSDLPFLRVFQMQLIKSCRLLVARYGCYLSFRNPNHNPQLTMNIPIIDTTSIWINSIIRKRPSWKREGGSFRHQLAVGSDRPPMEKSRFFQTIQAIVFPPGYHPLEYHYFRIMDNLAFIENTFDGGHR